MPDFYEQHNHINPEFTIFFHYDTIYPFSFMSSGSHWHEALEILYCTHGSGKIIIDCKSFEFSAGDTVIINSNALHNISSTSEEALKYYCLIADEAFCESFGFNPADTLYKEIVTDTFFRDVIKKIADELETQNEYYQPAVKSMVLSILVHISRNYTTGLRDASSEKNTKKAMVKKAIKYIRKNYSNPLSLDEIAAGIGFSRYYFCHIFKEMMGMSVISYINLIRCENAKSLMLLRKYSISEIALMCGFENFSYFSKTYKKYMGRLPSEDMK